MKSIILCLCRRQLGLLFLAQLILLLPSFASSEGGRLLRGGGGSGNYTATQPTATPPSLQEEIDDYFEEIDNYNFDFDIDDGFIIQIERTRRKLQQQNGNITSDMHHQADHIQPRIIGGNRVPNGKKRYTVGLVDDKGLFCGGALISRDIVLTAAHCGDGKTYVDIWAGSNYISDMGRPGSGGQMLYPTIGFIHPSYKWQTMSNDYMVYKLQSPITVPHELVQVNDKGSVPSSQNEKLTAIGWGDTDRNPNSYKGSDALLEVDVGYVTNNECAGRSGYVQNNFVSYRDQIGSNMLCALGNGKDACQGDSGGPIVKEGSRDLLVGLSSWGVDCAHSTLPGVYARVSSQYSWIRSIVCKYSKYPASDFSCGGRTPPASKPSTASRPSSGGVGSKPSGNKPSGNKPSGKKPSGNKKPSKNNGKKKKKKKKKKKNKNKKKNKREVTLGQRLDEQGQRISP